MLYVHNRVQDIEHVADDVRELVPEARVAVAHGQMDESRLERVVQRVLGARVRRARVHDDRRERPRHADGEHARRRPRRPARARAALPAARPRRPPRAARVRVPAASARPRAHRGGVRAAEDDRRVHRPRLGVQDRDARPRDPRRGQPARRRAVGPHRRGRLRPLLRDGHRGGRRAHGRGAASARPRCRSTCRSPRTCRATTSRATTCAWRRTAGSPRSRRRPTSTTCAPSGTTATARRRRPAAALLDVARLRAECVRLGIRAVSVQKGRARFDGLELRKSQEVRLQRLSPRVQVLADAVVVPVDRDRATCSLAQALLRLLAVIAPDRSGAGTHPLVMHRRPPRPSRRARRRRRRSSARERLLAARSTTPRRSRTRSRTTPTQTVDIRRNDFDERGAQARRQTSQFAVGSTQNGCHRRRRTAYGRRRARRDLAQPR